MAPCPRRAGKGDKLACSCFLFRKETDSFLKVGRGVGWKRTSGAEEGWPAAALEKLTQKTGLGGRRKKLESNGKQREWSQTFEECRKP